MRSISCPAVTISHVLLLSRAAADQPAGLPAWLIAPTAPEVAKHTIYYCASAMRKVVAANFHCQLELAGPKQVDSQLRSLLIQQESKTHDPTLRVSCLCQNLVICLAHRWDPLHVGQKPTCTKETAHHHSCLNCKMQLRDRITASWLITP